MTKPVAETQHQSRKRSAESEFVVQFENYEPIQARKKRQWKSSQSRSPCAQLQTPRVQSIDPLDPIVFEELMTENISLEDSTLFEGQFTAASPFDLLPTASTFGFPWSPVEHLDVLQPAPLLSLPCPGPSAQNKQLLCYCTNVNGFSDLDDEVWASIPVTADQPSNIYRSLLPMALYTTPHLYNAILAISSRHMFLKSDRSDQSRLIESTRFKHSAIEELGQSFSTVDTNNDSEVIASLATISTLIFYDTVEGALGKWSTHLDGAKKLITACGGIERIKRTTNMAKLLGVMIGLPANQKLITDKTHLVQHYPS
jgi:hypothetical protein